VAEARRTPAVTLWWAGTGLFEGHCERVAVAEARGTLAVDVEIRHCLADRDWPVRRPIVDIWSWRRHVQACCTPIGGVERRRGWFRCRRDCGRLGSAPSKDDR
jgi:hypothetical protein